MLCKPITGVSILDSLAIFQRIFNVVIYNTYSTLYCHTRILSKFRGNENAAPELHQFGSVLLPGPQYLLMGIT